MSDFWYWIVVNVAWVGFLVYIGFIMRSTWKDARRRRDERKIQESLIEVE